MRSLDASELKLHIWGDLTVIIIILDVNENICVQFVFCDRICNVEDFYKPEINFVFQSSCYLFHYLIKKILGFGVEFSTLLFSVENWKHLTMRADMMGAGVVLQGCLSECWDFFVEEIVALIKHGISKACGSLEDAMYFRRRRETDVSLY